MLPSSETQRCNFADSNPVCFLLWFLANDRLAIGTRLLFAL